MITFKSLGHLGRIGNQLFEYATLFTIANINGYKFGIPKQNEEKKFWVNDPRGKFRYGLELHNCFKLSAEKLDDTKFIRHNYNQPGFEYDENVFKIKDDTNIYGYFQSEKFFNKRKNEILQEFKFLPEIYNNAYKLIQKYRVRNGSLISVHIRRGDYLTMQDSHPILNTKYYLQAMNILKDFDKKQQHFLIFSDDLKWCYEKFNKNADGFATKKISFVDTGDQFIDMCMMSLCDHNIIANSSFSWWGAWLNKGGGKVISPIRWFGEQHKNLDIKDLIPKHWIKL